MLRRSTMTKSTLRVWGSVTWRKRRTAPAPSTVAASYRSGGMVCRRARYVTTTKGKNCHTLVMISDVMIQSLPSQATGARVMPPATRRWLTRPYESLSSHFQRITATIVRSEEHTSELQSLRHLVCRLLLEKKKKNNNKQIIK